MLRINLLPPYIYDKQKKYPWIVGSLALIPLTVGLLVWRYQVVQADLDIQNKRKEEAQTQQTQYNKLVQDIKAEDDAVAVTRSKQQFVSNAIKYNEAWPQVYAAMRDVTSPKVLLKSMYVSDDRKSINFTGFCQYEEDLVRWWMYLRQQTNMYTDVHFRLPEHPYPPKADNNGGGGGTGGLNMGGMSGGPMAGSPGMGGASPMAGNPNMGAPMAGSPGMGGMGGLAGVGSPGMGGGSFGGGGGNSDAVGDDYIEGRKGIKFTAFATLKQPLANGIPTPTWATGGGGSAPSGGAPMGSFGGGMGGSGGMMGMTSGGGGKGQGGN